MASQNEIQYDTPSQPRQLRLDTTSLCNASCLSCHRHLSKRKGDMPPELILEILTDVARWQKPLTEIVPVNYGELFMRKDWLRILEMIATKLPYTQIVLPTNGSFLDEVTVMSLCRIPTLRLINLSINAYFDDTYENFTGLKRETLVTIRKAVAQFRVLRPDIKIWASMVFDPEYQTDYERDAFINHWISFATPQILPAASAGRVGKKPFYAVKIPCRSIFSDIVVGYDKKITSCCFDPSFSLDLGHYSGSLLDNWRGAKLIELRRKHNEHRREDIDICKQCTFA